MTTATATTPVTVIQPDRIDEEWVANWRRKYLRGGYNRPPGVKAMEVLLGAVEGLQETADEHRRTKGSAVAIHELFYVATLLDDTADEVAQRLTCDVDHYGYLDDLGASQNPRVVWLTLRVMVLARREQRSIAAMAKSLRVVAMVRRDFF